MGNHCPGCGVCHEEDDDRLCAQCHNAKLTLEAGAKNKRWIKWEYADCPTCGNDVADVFTSCQSDGQAFDGDAARCSECGHPGSVHCTGEDIDGQSESASIVWHDDPDCDCPWCQSHPADPMSHSE